MFRRLQFFFLLLLPRLGLLVHAAPPQPESAAGWIGESLVDSRGNTVWARSLTECSYLLVYRAAETNEASRGFTPQLVRFWERNRVGNSFDVVLLSEDADREKMLRHLQTLEQPWYALEPSSPYAAKLRQRFDGSQLPALLLLDQSGEVLASSYRSDGEYVGTGSVLNILAERLLRGQKSEAELRAERLRAEEENRAYAMKLLHSQPDQLPVETLRNLFPITGVLKKSDGYVALMGSKVVKPGQVLENVVKVVDISRDKVRIRVGSRDVDLYPPGYRAP